jgi:hypothetical protein
VPAAFERQIIEDQIAMHEALRLRSDDGDRTTRKRIEAIKERLSERLESIKGRRDDMVIDNDADNNRLTSRGYTIRHIETWHRDGVSESFVVWDPPEITEADLPF